MNKNNTYTLDLSKCKTSEEIMIAIEADLNARKQLGLRKVIKMKWNNLFK